MCKKNLDEKHHEKMWEKMTECCCSDMTDEEKQRWSKDMHKLMHHMHECGGPGMGMMGGIMGKMHGKGERGHMPWDMCKDMISSIKDSHKVATMATPEVQGLFEDWVEQIEKELLDFLKDKKTVDVKDIASHFKISKDSAYYFLTKLAQKGKINLSIKNLP
jgi:hypothetical protein